MQYLTAYTVDEPAHSVIEPATRSTAPLYPLQPSAGHDTLPREDLKLMRQQEDQVFEQLGWNVDPVTGIPAIPPAVIAAINKPASMAATTRPATTPVAPRHDGGAP